MASGPPSTTDIQLSVLDLALLDCVEEVGGGAADEEGAFDVL